MRETAKLIKWLVLLLIVGVAIWAVVWYKKSEEEVPVAKVEPARIIDIRPMVKLCSMEIYEDIPVRAHIGKRHIFARTTLAGSITFDLEQAESCHVGDTLRVTLPPEKVEIYESTEKGAYKVIDTWNERLLGSSNFTAAEENEIKRKVVEAWRDSIYLRGYVRRARAEAVRNLEMMLRPFAAGGEVIVEDTIPEGIRK